MIFQFLANKSPVVVKMKKIHQPTIFQNFFLLHLISIFANFLYISIRQKILSQIKRLAKLPTYNVLIINIYIPTCFQMGRQ